MPTLCATPAPARLLVYRVAIPTTALLLFAAMAFLWAWGAHAVYFAILRLFIIRPFRFPFLDIHAVLAAAQCHRQGFDVYLSNPCDALHRPHVYSPLWLRIVPRSFDTSATVWVGFGLDLVFILSLFLVLRPARCREILLLGLVTLSPMTVFALERANNDLLVFELILVGCMAGAAARPLRFLSYALYLVAALLKYYPLVLLVLVVRERRRDAIVILALAVAVLLLFVAGEHGELAKALANVPLASYFTDAFSAQNLTFGLADKLVAGPRRTIVGLLLFVALTLVAGARTRRTLRLLGETPAGAGRFEHECLVAGAILLTSCFFAGQNVDYRGIYFILVMPGLIRLYRAAEDDAVRRFLGHMQAAVVLVCWGEPLRRAVHAAAAAVPSLAVQVRIEVLFWLGRELLWWWLIAGLAAIGVSCLLRDLRCGPVAAGIRFGLVSPTERGRRQIPG